MPRLLLPPLTPFTSQVTVVFEVPVTVALNCFVFCDTKLALVGLMVTATAWGVPPVDSGATVTAAVADLVLSSLLIAVTDTDRFVLTAGAV